MTITHHFFAFDIGATSGRSILATLSENKLELQEISRFPNKIIRENGHLYWDIMALFEALKDGLKKVSALNVKLDAIGIDTWGVDFVYLDSKGEIVEKPRCYRDPYTNGAPEDYLSLSPKRNYMT